MLLKNIVILDLIYSFIQVHTECTLCACNSFIHRNIPKEKKDGVQVAIYCKDIKKTHPRGQGLNSVTQAPAWQAQGLEFNIQSSP